MISSLETLTLAGWHPDAGVWPLILVVSLGAVLLVVRPVKS